MHRQLSNILTNNGELLRKHSAPLPEDGNLYLTFEELRGLHKSQSLD